MCYDAIIVLKFCSCYDDNEEFDQLLCITASFFLVLLSHLYTHTQRAMHEFCLNWLWADGLHTLGHGGGNRLSQEHFQHYSSDSAIGCFR